MISITLNIDGNSHGLITIADLSDGAAIADYECRLTDVEGREQECTIYGHRREDGPWVLVRRVVERMVRCG